MAWDSLLALLGFCLLWDPRRKGRFGWREAPGSWFIVLATSCRLFTSLEYSGGDSYSLLEPSAPGYCDGRICYTLSILCWFNLPLICWVCVDNSTVFMCQTWFLKPLSWDLVTLLYSVCDSVNSGTCGLKLASWGAGTTSVHHHATLGIY